MLLKDYEFGYADAMKEYIRMPEIFEKAFCDVRNISHHLLDSYDYLLVGRKGVGKSAYSAKIQNLSDKSDTLYAYSMNLNDFEFTTFGKTSIDDDILGTQKYKASWDFLLLVSIFKILYNNMQMTEIDEICDVVSLLDALGFSVNSNYKADVTRLSKLKVGAGIAKFDIEFEKEFCCKPASYLERITVLTEKMLKVIQDIYLNNRELIIIIDGLDDILRYRKNKIDIIASLIRSIDYLNDKIVLYKKKIKIILLIREDLLAMVNDPDLNKIVQDGAIFLNWGERLKELRKLVDLRFSLSGLTIEEAEKCWDKIFPRKIKQKDSWNYVLEYTLYKPRDILQFLQYCKREYPQNERLSLSETQNVLKVYSNKYFIEEMKNELSGFFDDELINALPSAFRKLGGRAFELTEINKYMNQGSERAISIDETKMLIYQLFEAGYIGQILNNGKDRKGSVIFKYRNPTARIDYYQKFITHKGLHSGLGVRI